MQVYSYSKSIDSNVVMLVLVTFNASNHKHFFKGTERL